MSREREGGESWVAVQTKPPPQSNLPPPHDETFLSVSMRYFISVARNWSWELRTEAVRLKGPKIKVEGQEQRWGSCGKKKQISVH